MSTQGVGSTRQSRGIGDPCPVYDSIKDIWLRNRAVCSGERFVKAYDEQLDKVTFSNMLIPFSGEMTQKQYNVFRSEAELPGIVAEYAKFLVGGLLRKKPVLKLPDGIPDEVEEWIYNAFAADGKSLVAFLDEAIWEEVQTGRAWIYIDYPEIDISKVASKEELYAYKPFPTIWKAESVINWKTETDIVTGQSRLIRVVVRNLEMQEESGEEDFHPMQK